MSWLSVSLELCLLDVRGQGSHPESVSLDGQWDYELVAYRCGEGWRPRSWYTVTNVSLCFPKIGDLRFGFHSERGTEGAFGVAEAAED